MDWVNHVYLSLFCAVMYSLLYMPMKYSHLMYFRDFYSCTPLFDCNGGFKSSMLMIFS